MQYGVYKHDSGASEIWHVYIVQVSLVGVGYHYQRADLGKMVKQGTRQEAQASEDICIAIGILDRYGTRGTMMMKMMIMIMMLTMMAL